MIGGTDPGPVPGSHARVVVVADMLFASRVRGAAGAAGVQVRTVGRADGLAEALRGGEARLVLVDLEMRAGDPVAAVRQVRSDPELGPIPIVGFASHTNAAVFEAAREAGADRVMARSAFIRQLPELLAGAADD